MPKEVEQLATFVEKARFEDISKDAVFALKIRILDSLGCAFGALSSPVSAMIKAQIDDFGGNPLVSLIGGGKSAPDRACFYNSALIRYLDFNDSFLAKHETCHPSDNIGAVLAASEYADASGKEFLTALAVAYQVHCRLSMEAPVRRKGFDHTTQGAYAVGAGVGKALRLPAIQIANGIAIGAVSNNALRVTRTGVLSHWKGLAYPNTAFSCLHAAFLAMRGITGPLEIFEGNKGFKDAIAGPFFIDWSKENLEAVLKTIIKKYNAEIHSQSALEAISGMRKELSISKIERIDVEVFDVAFHIIGGGEEGGKKEIITKEEADHSLPYLLAVILLDGEVTPKQYEPSRIVKKDVQELLHKIHIQPHKKHTDKFPNEMPIAIKVTSTDGSIKTAAQNDYEGFFTKPMGWQHAVDKFHTLTLGRDSKALIEAVKNLEQISIKEFTRLLI